MQKITSRDNQKIKFARKIRDRAERDFLFVEGVRLAEEFVKTGREIFDCFFSSEFAGGERNRHLLDQISAKIDGLFEVPERVFNSLSDTKNSQGIILIGEKPATGKEKIDLRSAAFEKFPFLVLLHEINNPNNLGAILRSCEAAGAGGVILTKNSADVFSPKALRAAMGASFRLSFWTDAEFEKVLDWAKKNDLATICADVNSEKNLWEIDWKKPRLVVFGSEAHGLTANERDQIDEGLIIPMEKTVESLNLAVSCALVLYEAKRNWLLK